MIDLQSRGVPTQNPRGTPCRANRLPPAIPRGVRQTAPKAVFDSLRSCDGQLGIDARPHRDHAQDRQTLRRTGHRARRSGRGAARYPLHRCSRIGSRVTSRCGIDHDKPQGRLRNPRRHSSLGVDPTDERALPPPARQNALQARDLYTHHLVPRINLALSSFP